MSTKKALIPILVFVILNGACGYIVLPEGILEPESVAGEWTAVATNVTTSSGGDLHVDLTIQNTTGDWSVMQAVEGRPAVLEASGETADCETVYVGSGGHRLAPGFQMRGYTGGTKAEPEIQLLYVECAGADAGSGAVLSIDYVYYTGRYNYYDPENNEGEAQRSIAI